MARAGFLPDISSQFGFWREYSVNALREKNYESAQAGLFNLNHCLTDEYLVRISTKEYSELISDSVVFQCDHCTMDHKEIINKGEENEKLKITKVPTETHHSKIKIMESHCNAIDQVLLSFAKTEKNYDSMINGYSTKTIPCRTRKFWICPECKNENYQEGDSWNTIKSVREQPFTLGVIPEPPIKPKHLAKSLGYPEKFAKWFYNFLEEIQAKLVLYRIEYTAQNGQDMTEPEYKGEK